MTRAEFEELERSIENQKFAADCSDPITYGIARAAFDQEKYRKLIEAAREMDSTLAWEKVAGWTNQFEEARRSQIQLERLRKELRPHLIFATQTTRWSDGGQVRAPGACSD